MNTTFNANILITIKRNLVLLVVSLVSGVLLVVSLVISVLLVVSLGIGVLVFQVCRADRLHLPIDF